MIKLNVSAANVAVEEKETLTEGRVGLLCQFRFTDEWTGLAKTAVFDGADSRDVILNSDTVAIPAECLSTEGYSLSVGVYGKNSAGDIVIPTVYATVGKIQRSAYPSGKETAAPTPDVVAQIQQAAANAEAIARSVRDDADLGKFNGGQGPQGPAGATGPKGDTGAAGEAGGYYTPAVTQPDENTMRLSFSPSKEDMPAVADTDIPLSAGGSGLTDAQINALDGMFKVCAFIKADISAEYNEFCTAFGIEAATITGISATYSGGNVTAGISVDELTGIVVTANYSDGSKRTVTGYTLSGTIAEGSNTITVTYEGMTTTFTVTGVAEEVTLSSISATYSGGPVPAGTALDDLTGIVVTAQYSDGSTATVTGYTLSGEITEGSNTITVTYQDKTATFTVTGTAATQVYTVTNNLTNVTNSNSQTEVTDGFYSATLTVVDGYSMNSVVITMGGVDITDSVYGDGGILITDVTGDIVITAVAGTKLVYILTEDVGVFKDTGVYDTGFAMYSGGDRFRTVCMEMSVFSSPWATVTYIPKITTNTFGVDQSGAKKWRAYFGNGNSEITADGLADGVGNNIRFVVALPTTGYGGKIYTLQNESVATTSIESYGGVTTNNETTLKLGSAGCDATIHDFRVYEQEITAAQIETYLRGGDI